MKRLVIAAVAWIALATSAAAQIVTGSQPFVFVNGTIIDATRVNADYNYIIGQVNANGAKGGVNNDITALLSLTTPLTPAQSGSNVYYNFNTATGTVDDIVVASAVPAGFTLAAGKSIRFRASGANTGPVTLAVNGTTATGVIKATPTGLVALSGGEFQTAQQVEAYFDGVHYQVLSNTGEQDGGFGPDTYITAAATTDLGSIAGHNVHITGSGVIISSFGASASTAYPLYIAKVDGTNTLVGSAALALPNAAASVNVNANDQFMAAYLGAGAWRVVAIFPAQVYAARAGASRLTIANNAGTPTTKVDVTASEIVMENGSGGNYRLVSYGTCTIDFTASGAGGLDAGSIAANHWYYLYAIGTGSASSCIAGSGPVAPTMPSNYTYLVRLGAIKTNSGAATLWPIYQAGPVARFTDNPTTVADRQVLSGASGTCGTTVTSTTVATWGVTVPTTARDVTVTLGVNSAVTGVFQFPMSTTSYSVAAGTQIYSAGTVEQEATVPYIGATTLNVCGQAGSTIYVDGWTDNVNVN
jgi:filamentous hemagglutinin